MCVFYMVGHALVRQVTGSLIELWSTSGQMCTSRGGAVDVPSRVHAVSPLLHRPSACDNQRSSQTRGRNVPGSSYGVYLGCCCADGRAPSQRSCNNRPATHRRPSKAASPVHALVAGLYTLPRDAAASRTMMWPALHSPILDSLHAGLQSCFLPNCPSNDQVAGRAHAAAAGRDDWQRRHRRQFQRGAAVHPHP